MKNQDNIDRYLKICRFARLRYTTTHSTLITHIGGEPTKYQRIIDAAYLKYVINGG